MTAQRKNALVAGGGIIGLACAQRLLQCGFSVTVADAEGAAKPPSWGNAGVIAVAEVEPLASWESMRKALRFLLSGGGAFTAPVGDIRTWLPFFLRMARASGRTSFEAGTAALGSCMEQALPAWRRILDDVGQRQMLIESGHFVVWESRQSARRCLASWNDADTGPTSFRVITGEELDRLEAVTGNRPFSGIRFAGTAQISDPGLLLDALKRSILSAGGKFVATRVVGIDADRGKRASLVTEDGESRTADVIVVAAGVDSGRLMRKTGAIVPVIAERGYHIQSAAAEGHWNLPPVVYEDRAMVVTGFQSALRATSFVEFARHDRPATVARWESLERHIDELGLPFSKPRSRWMGARPTLPDYLPAIGRSPIADNLLYAFGHQHLGLTMAAVTGEIIAALACGREPPIDLRPFDIRRFGR